jgi:transitional endoplasmic reticulum ATPase
MPLKGVDIKDLAKRTEGFSGADIEALCREAAMNALRENMKAKEVTRKNFEDALEKITPSLSRELESHYEKFVERQRRMAKTEEEKEAHSYIG